MILKDKSNDLIEITFESDGYEEVGESYEASYLCDSDREVTDETVDWLRDTYYMEIIQDAMENLMDAADYYEPEESDDKMQEIWLGEKE